ncbi:MAG: hypothetical protein K9G67_10490 [Bacteroidales bacterium]|nr:hypothetical protein [Bacteroidales bacterium]MCF8343437.1 hypothetical protein [Bacteroidales bacterium]MCF8349892.1 hypothetical protein [Bacteroidales bacterium]MCF8376773.1 hypothetical protein [Bacteroidales bacterium]
MIFILNIPFGYWRDNVKKFSMKWYLAVHIPVPLVIVIRLLSEIGWHWSSYVVFVLAFFLGQFTGGLLHRKKMHTKPECTTSCLIMDLYRNC